MFEKHGGDISTHPTHNPQLWVGSQRAINRPDKNRVYKMHMASTREITSCCTASTLDT